MYETAGTNCCIHKVYFLMMGYRYARNMWRFFDEIYWGQIVYQKRRVCGWNKNFKNHINIHTII